MPIAKGRERWLCGKSACLRKGAWMFPVDQTWVPPVRKPCGLGLAQEGHLEGQRASGTAGLPWLWAKHNEPEGNYIPQLENCKWEMPTLMDGWRKTSESPIQMLSQQGLSLKHLPAPESKQPTHDSISLILIIPSLISSFSPMEPPTLQVSRAIVSKQERSGKK